MSEAKRNVCGLPPSVRYNPLTTLGPWPSLTGKRYIAELFEYDNLHYDFETYGYLFVVKDEDRVLVARLRLEIGEVNKSVLFDRGSTYVVDPVEAKKALVFTLTEGVRRAVFYGGLEGEVTFRLEEKDNPLGLTYNNESRSTEKPVQPHFGIAGFDDYEYDLAQAVRCAVLRILRTKYNSGVSWPDVVRSSGLSATDVEFARAFLLRENLVETLQGRDPVAYRINDRGVNWLSEHEDQLGSRRDLASVGAGGRSEYILPPGDRYRAMSLVLRVMQLAQARLFMVDAYLDDTVFLYVEAVDPDVEVRLLTASRKPMFCALLEEMKKTRPSIDAREFQGECHDRFLVIDDNTVWHLGASINRLGSKLTRLSRVSDEEDRKRYLGIFDDLWKKGTPISL